MTDRKPTPPRDDEELVACIDAATRPAPWTPVDEARLRARVASRLAESRTPGALRWGLAASLAAAGFALVLWTGRADHGPPAPQRAAAPTTAAGATLEDSYEDQLLFAPEWVERDGGYVDSEVLPENYAVASAFLASK